MQVLQVLQELTVMIFRKTKSQWSNFPSATVSLICNLEDSCLILEDFRRFVSSVTVVHPEFDFFWIQKPKNISILSFNINVRRILGAEEV